MPGQMQPSSKKDAPDPADSYERAHPEREAGMGKLDVEQTAPHECPDKMEQAVGHRQDPTRQLNGGDAINRRGGPTSEQPVHSMKDDEPTDADLAPEEIANPEEKRYPRTGGKGGTPDAGEPTSQA